MNAEEFWSHLEFRVCREIEGLSGAEFRGWWCDGFIPEDFLSNEGHPNITGIVWMCPGQEQQRWRFTLLLPRNIRAEEEINYEAIFPPEELTGWLSLDKTERKMVVDPMTAHLDLEQ